MMRRIAAIWDECKEKTCHELWGQKLQATWSKSGLNKFEVKSEKLIRKVDWI